MLFRAITAFHHDIRRHYRVCTQFFLNLYGCRVYETMTNRMQCRLSPDEMYKLCEAPKIEFINWLQDQGLLAKTYLCPRCKTHNMHLVSNSSCSDGLRWQCCNIHRPIRGGSVFEHRHLTLQEMLQLTYHWCMKASPDYARIALKCKGRNTVCRWYQFCREICMKYIMEREEKLGGPGKIVDIDESLFGKRKYNRGRCVTNPQWVLGGIERGGNKCFLVPVEKRDRQTLEKVILDHVLPGTTIYTDCWGAYNRLAAIGFERYTVNHSKNFVDSDTGVHTNTIEGTWSCVKRTLPKAGKKAEYLVHYFAEFMWRRQFAVEDDPFLAFLGILAHMFPPLSADADSIEPEEHDTERCHVPPGPDLDHTYARALPPPGIPHPDHSYAAPVPYITIDHDYL